MKRPPESDAFLRKRAEKDRAKLLAIDAKGIRIRGDHVEMLARAGEATGKSESQILEDILDTVFATVMGLNQLMLYLSASLGVRIPRATGAEGGDTRTVEERLAELRKLAEGGEAGPTLPQAGSEQAPEGDQGEGL